MYSVYAFPTWKSYVEGCPRIPDSESQGHRQDLNVFKCGGLSQLEWVNWKVVAESWTGAPECRSPRGTDRAWMSYVEGCPREQDPESQRHRQQTWLEWVMWRVVGLFVDPTGTCPIPWSAPPPLSWKLDHPIDQRAGHSGVPCSAVFCSRVLCSILVFCSREYLAVQIIMCPEALFLCTGTMRISVAHWHTYLAQSVPHLSGTKCGTLIWRAGVLAPEHLWYAGGLLHTEKR